METSKQFIDRKQQEHFKTLGVYADTNSKIAEWMDEYATQLTTPINMDDTKSYLLKEFGDDYFIVHKERIQVGDYVFSEPKMGQKSISLCETEKMGNLCSLVSNNWKIIASTLPLEGVQKLDKILIEEWIDRQPCYNCLYTKDQLEEAYKTGHRNGLACRTEFRRTSKFNVVSFIEYYEKEYPQDTWELGENDLKLIEDDNS